MKIWFPNCSSGSLLTKKHRASCKSSVFPPLPDLVRASERAGVSSARQLA